MVEALDYSTAQGTRSHALLPRAGYNIKGVNISSAAGLYWRRQLKGACCGNENMIVILGRSSLCFHAAPQRMKNQSRFHVCSILRVLFKIAESKSYHSYIHRRCDRDSVSKFPGNGIDIGVRTLVLPVRSIDTACLRPVTL